MNEVVVFGGGNSGLEAAVLLGRFARHVAVIEAAEHLGGSRILQDKIGSRPTITVLTGTRLLRLDADDHGRLVSLHLARADGTEFDHPANGAFVFIGMRPNTEWLAGTVVLDDRGFVTTDRTMATSIDGIFAAGDVRAGSTKQLASAVGEGAAAGIQIRSYLQAQTQSSR